MKKVSNYNREKSVRLAQERLTKYIPIPETGCWLFAGRWTGQKYGSYKAGGGHYRAAHRFFYERFVGPIPDGMLVCHKCDTPPCVNPSHLFLGTTTDNAQDRKRKGRQDYSGERNGRALLTWPEVLEIRAAPVGGKQLADRYGVSAKTITDIRANRRWVQKKEQTT